MKNKLIISLLTVAILILAACGNHEATTTIKKEKENNNTITIIGSGSKALPDYSETSIKKAIGDGTKYIKLKLVVNKSGTLYVAGNYDTQVEVGKKGNIGLLTDKKIKKYTYKNGESINSLESILKKYGKKTNVVIETSMINQLLVMEDKVIKIVKDEKIEKNVVFSSFYLESLLSLKNKMPDVSNIYLVKNANRGFIKDYADISKLDFLALNQHYIDTSVVSAIQDKEKGILSFSEPKSKSTVSGKLKDDLDGNYLLSK
ncbi:exported hypothetical protein [Brochothrix thermosphacta]|uniref:glycerophosphodiester phosphodiesterase n=1 Tax=Brochothrix thermosphacta TaxID=2756 RepID=UPI000D1086FD|nr:hypothetical protein [Brochothrix thermosphacta]SOC27790.1 exported hypothetical protein [Brochothrix thermosphacta]